MNTSSLRAFRAPYLRAASALALAGLLSSFLAQPIFAAPKGGGSPEPVAAESRIAIGPETTPGDVSSLYKITQPGSYYLSANVLGEINKYGISITAGGVTLDLNGFAVLGAGHEGSLGSGIFVLYPSGPVRILNGTVSNWKDNGIEAHTAVLELESLRLSDNGRSGLRLSADTATITRCIAEENGEDGFSVVPSTPNTSTISESSANRNGRDGFSGLSARQCGAALNGRHGFHGGYIIESCTAIYNVEDGINDASQILHSSANGNRRHGIYVVTSTQVTGNSASSNGGNSGIYGSGIWVAGDGNSITGNRSSANRRGMTVTGTHNRIEDNHFTFNSAFGFWCSGQNNIIIRNTARNTSGINWSIAANNRAGAFVAPASSPVITGSTGGNGSGTTDPFANLSF